MIVSANKDNKHNKDVLLRLVCVLLVKELNVVHLLVCMLHELIPKRAQVR